MTGPGAASPGGTLPARRPGRPIARFIAASGLANLGDGIATLAWAWTASVLTRDPVLVAALAVLLRLPWAIFALPAGVLIDRLDRRAIVVRMDLLRALAFAAVAAVLWSALPLPPAPATGVSSVPVYLALVAAALVVGVAEVFRDNAAQTMLPSLVHDDRLEAANGRLWSVEMIGNALAGPPLGALLVAAALPLPFAANLVAYAVAGAIVATLPATPAPARNGGSWRAELAEGLLFLRRSPLLRLLAWVTGTWNLFMQMVLIALVLHVQETLGLSPTQYGLVLAAGAVGGIGGAIAGGPIVARIGPVRATQWSLAASPPAFALIAVAPGAWTLALTFAVFEFAGTVWNTVSVASRQRMVPDALLGRVTSAYRLLAWGMMPVGLLLSGLIVRGMEPLIGRQAALTAPFWAAAAGAALLTAVSWRPLRAALSHPLRRAG